MTLATFGALTIACAAAEQGVLASGKVPGILGLNFRCVVLCPSSRGSGLRSRISRIPHRSSNDQTI